MNIIDEAICCGECGYREDYDSDGIQFQGAVSRWEEKGCPKCGKR